MSEGDVERALCADTGSQLRRGLGWDAALVLAALTVVYLGWPWTDVAARTLAVLLALSTTVMSWHHLRLRLDAGVFAGWAQAGDLPAAMRDFDRRLQRWRKAVPTRDLQQRVAGALALLARHRRWRALQALLLLATLALSLLRP